MAPDPTDRPTLDPDEIAKRSFERSRKGYEVDAVRAYLVGLASQLREANRQRADLERRLVEVERRAADITELDEDAVTQMLGEETARVLETARKAAAEIRGKAEEKALATVAEAAEKATSTREAADQYADGVRAAADEAVATQRAEAEAYEQDVRSRADADTAALRSEADEYARTVREAADAEVAELRATASGEVDRLRSEAESVLAERTSEAEEAAAAIRADADSYRARVHEEADAYAESTRAEADTYQADVQGRADADRTAAREEAERLVADAQASADELRQRADADAAASREAAQVDADRVVAEAREQGRSMVQEARSYRERVIADLADRRRAARANLEQLAAARDALAVTLTDVKARIDTSHRALEEVVLDPREIGDPAVDRRALEASDRPATSVAVGEIDGGDAAAGDATDDEAPAGEARSVGEGPEQDAGGEAAAAAGEGEGAGDEHAGEVAVVASVDPITGIVSIDAPGAGHPGGPPAPSEAGAPAAAEPAAAEPAAAEAAHDDRDDAGQDQGAAIFAKLRAGRSKGTGRAAKRAAKGGGVAVAEPEAAVEEVVAGGTAEPPAEVDLRDRPGEGGGDDEPAEPEAVAPVEEAVADEPVGAEAVSEGDAVAEDEGDEPTGEAAGVDPDQDLLDRRDAATDEVERQLARRLKRVLSDEQNESLDLLRRAKGKGTAAEVLPDLEAHHARYRDAALEDLRAAERAGAGFFGEAPARTADVSDVAAEFADELVRQVRGRLERAFEEGQGDEQEVGERIRACYREWKTQRIADTARHFVVAAFSRGATEAAPDGSSFRWLVDDGGAPCPDCDDNALAGAVGKGEPFPTGDLCPPAHPGCRCVAVPVDA